MKGLYTPIKKFIEPEEARELAECIRKAPMSDGDAQVPKSRAYYNLPACSILLGKMLDKVSHIAGIRLKPAYAYCRIYFKGATLAPHKDRESCEYSVTINLSQTHPWVIYMGKKAIKQNSGDGVVYKGCEIEHSRKEFRGDEYIQVFLHYVNADGPFKDHVFDLKKDEPVDKFRLILSGDPFPTHTSYYRFLTGIPTGFVDDLRKILDSKPLHDAEVGGDSNLVNASIRRSKIFWLPKNEEFFPIYDLLFKHIIKCNNEFYHFRLSEIIENIQYTVYDASDQGYYDWHLDMGPGKARRKLSLVCQLSDPSEYEGGELQIHNGQVTVPEKEKGVIILFPSYLLHRVTPVTKGTRRSLVLWIDGPAFI